MQLSHIDHATKLCIRKSAELFMTHFMMVHSNQLYQSIMRCVLQGVCNSSSMYFSTPWVNPCSLSDHIQLIIHQHGMFTGDKVMPLPGLTAKESKTANDGPGQPFDHAFFIIIMTCMHSQHHGYGADDQDEGHHTHKRQR